MALKAVEPRRLYRLVAEQIRQFILSEALPIGSRLPTERELAERLDVSRPTVREALIALEVEGRVHIRIGSGIYVAEPRPLSPGGDDHDGPFELLRARALIEGAVAEEAARLMTPEALARIDAILAQMRAAPLVSESLMALDCAFHTAMAEVIGNAVITRTVTDLFNRRVSPYFGRLAGYFEGEATWRSALAEHRAIRDALAARDPAAAAAALRLHLDNSQQRFSASFGEGPSLNHAAQ